MTRISGWKHVLTLSCGLLAATVSAARAETPVLRPFADADHVTYVPTRGGAVPKATGDLIYHGGPVITSAKAVLIFWGPSFNNAASPDYAYARTLQAFRDQLGTSAAWRAITQYSAIQLTNLGGGTADWFDTTTPPINVTDSAARSKVSSYLTTHPFDNSTIYEVFLPSTSYSSSGTSTSCGGPNVAYCSYHGSFSSAPGTAKYTVQPYPSCGACQVPGWTTTQDQERLVCHETREAVTDPTLSAWYDSSGREIIDKCVTGTPTDPCDKAWSNAVHGCV